VSEGEKTRLVAWYDEMRAVHGRLRRALALVRQAAAEADEPPGSQRPPDPPRAARPGAGTRVAAHDRPARDRVARRAGPDTAPLADLLVWCRGFCTALTRHHTAEDAVLFPELERRHPDLADVLRRLRQDHGMIAYLVADLEHALDRAADPEASRDAVGRHLDGVGAIMESHFRYEERALGEVLAALDLGASRDDVLGPL
jgi:hypothetical protein